MADHGAAGSRLNCDGLFVVSATTIATVVVAAATVVYVFLTNKLAKHAKTSAAAAKDSADAAKASAQAATAALNHQAQEARIARSLAVIGRWNHPGFVATRSDA